MADPPSLFPEYLEQQSPTAQSPLVDAIQLQLDAAPDVVVDETPVQVLVDTETDVEVSQDDITVEVPE